jgi:hypothetical protein
MTDAALTSLVDLDAHVTATKRALESTMARLASPIRVKGEGRKLAILARREEKVDAAYAEHEAALARFQAAAGAWIQGAE